ncbi:oleate hydratase [Kipferlia bialata]|uniref:Oleate hydratase n=1 Tax=Kipferlia bialata TaxID=797122 RepID=A0A9K3CW17_9EUKA|nr:oleate hydratase [Kipferlia bialata]|eukprot:g5711.t1
MSFAKTVLTGAALAGAAVYGAKVCQKAVNKGTKAVWKWDGPAEERHAYFVGGGLGSMSGAAFLIRDCGFRGENIHILEGESILGGANDGSGTDREGFVCRGGRMLNKDLYENMWDLLGDIPSIDVLGQSCLEEIWDFDTAHPTKGKARLVDIDRNIMKASDMGLCNTCRLLLGKLSLASYESLDNVSIDDYFGGHEHFYKTNFWYMWQTTFAFQPWSSVFEMKRYMRRCIKFFDAFDTLGAVCRTSQIYLSLNLLLQNTQPLTSFSGLGCVSLLTTTSNSFALAILTL